MLDLRKRILLIIVGAVGVVAALVLFLLTQRRQALIASPRVDEPSALPAANGSVSAPATPARDGAPQPAGAADERRYVRQVSATFVERFGSFSNQNENAHLADPMSLSTPRMRSWLATQNQAFGAVYAGVTTHVVASSVTSFADGRASVAIDAQQEKSTPTTTVAAYRHGRVELEKVGNDWLVDGLYWE